MRKIIKEGNVIIKIKKANKVSKEMDVFYNPVMKLNRDVSVLLLNSMNSKNLQIALPLAATGIRGIRFLKELDKGKIKNIVFNDYDKDTIESVKNNLKLNNIKKFSTLKKISNKKSNNKIKISNDDANLLLLNSKGFDYIDIDPFGSSNIFLDSAIKRISRNGILAVTNTDTAALAGTYPKVCRRKYWANPKRDYLMHETGLRILIRKAQLVGMQYEKALIPVFSYFKDHYFRIFFKCVKGKKECDKLVKEHGMLNEAGPLWLGSLFDSKLANKMYNQLLKKPLNKKTIKDKKIIDNYNYGELVKFLKIIKEESKIDVVGFYDMHNIVKKKKLKSIIKKEDLIKKIKKEGFKASNSHFLGTGIRTDIEFKKLIKLF